LKNRRKNFIFQRSCEDQGGGYVHLQSGTSGPGELERAAPMPKDREPESDPALTSIRDLAKEFAVSARELRFYEVRGLLKPQRDGINRYYGPQDRLRLKMILHGKRLGFSLREIRDILEDKNPAGEVRAAAADARGRADGEVPDSPEAPTRFGRLLPVDQIAAQIDHLERQRKELDDVLLFLRNARTRLDGAGPV
jgi:DNA-binding transcriptional MerR regulator